MCPVGGQPVLHQRLADALRAVQHLRVADALPVTATRHGRVAAGDEGAAGCHGGPVFQAVCQARGAGLQRFGRRQQRAAVFKRLNFHLQLATDADGLVDGVHDAGTDTDRGAAGSWVPRPQPAHGIAFEDPLSASSCQGQPGWAMTLWMSGKSMATYSSSIKLLFCKRSPPPPCMPMPMPLCTAGCYTALSEALGRMGADKAPLLLATLALGLLAGQPDAQAALLLIEQTERVSAD